jgi:hypothetical protein
MAGFRAIGIAPHTGWAAVQVFARSLGGIAAGPRIQGTRGGPREPRRAEAQCSIYASAVYVYWIYGENRVDGNNLRH